MRTLDREKKSFHLLHQNTSNTATNISTKTSSFTSAEQFHEQHQQQLQAIQHLQQLQHHEKFHQSEDQQFVTSLTNQGYDPPSNNGQYIGPSSYDVKLNSRTKLY